MSDRVLCRYYMNGCCKFGQSCDFSHDFNDAPDMVCKYFLAGCCAYGDKCRYDHKKPDDLKRKQTEASSSGPSNPGASISGHKLGTQGALQSLAPMVSALPFVPQTTRPVSRTVPQVHTPGTASNCRDRAGVAGGQPGSCEKWKQESSDAWGDDGYQEGDTIDNSHTMCTELSGEERQQRVWAHKGGILSWEEEDDLATNFGKGGVNGQGAAWENVPSEDSDPWEGPSPSQEAQTPECSLCWEYMSSGFCVNGDLCPMIHGDYCEICQKHSLHPTDENQRKAHMEECGRRHSRLDAYIHSAEMECGICLEKIYSNSDPSLRKFGLMNCDHCFCLSCIRSWRANNDGHFDISSALRTCPICRTTTYFVTPSTVWPSTDEEKEQIIQGYKKKLAGMDCKYFNFGDGTCPFGNSCFYRHVDRNGKKKEIDVRFVANSEGQVKSVRPMYLGDILNTSRARRVLSNRRR